MSLQFDSLHAFIWMEGHGPYVWAAYVITFVGLAGLALKARLDRKHFYRTRAAIARRNSQGVKNTVDKSAA